MKPLHFVAPAAALLISVVWISRKEGNLTALEKQTNFLRERVQLARSVASESSSGTSGATFGSGDSDSVDEFTLPDGSTDWLAIADIMGDMKANGMPSDVKSMLKIQQKLMTMEAEELAAGIEAVKNLDLKKDNLEMLTGTLIQQLSEKNPKLALEAMEGPINSQQSQSHWELRNAFQKLAADDPDAAQRWLDRKIAAGELDTKALDRSESPRFEFEAGLVAGLLARDPKAANERLADFSPEERERVLDDYHQFRVKGKFPEGYADLIRENLEPEKSEQKIGDVFGSVHFQGSLEKISGLLTEKNFSENEKSAIVAKAITTAMERSKNDKEAVRNAWRWAKTQRPERAIDLTSNGLQNLYLRRRNLEPVFEMALSLGEPEIAESFVATLAASEFVGEDFKTSGFTNPETKRRFDEIVSNLPPKPDSE